MSFMNEPARTLFGESHAASNGKLSGDERQPMSGVDGEARLLRPDRLQVVFETVCLDELVSPEHRVRQVWTFVERVETRALEDRIRSRHGHVGAPAVAPRLLLGLWLYACLNGVGSARELNRLCREHSAYRWMCGRVGVNYHSLSDFRADAGEFLDNLLTEMIAAMVRAGVVDGASIVQDGTKVRASAGGGSFRREKSLERLREEAKAHVEKVKAQADDPALGARVKAARERAAEDRVERVEAALAAMKRLQDENERKRAKSRHKDRKVKEPRISTTDAEAKRMKMSDGGHRPAYNVQLGTDVKSRAIVGVRVTDQGNDVGLNMRQEVERRTGVKVTTHITDGGYVNKAVIEKEEGAGVACVMPPPKNKEGKVPGRQDGEGPGVGRWRERMKTDEAAALLRRRGGIAETPNAELKTQRSLERILVRGLGKVRAVMLLGAVVYNLTHFASVWVGQPLVAR